MSIFDAWPKKTMAYFGCADSVVTREHQHMNIHTGPNSHVPGPLVVKVGNFSSKYMLRKECNMFLSSRTFYVVDGCRVPRQPVPVYIVPIYSPPKM